MDLSELLSTHRDEIIRGWMQKVKGTIHPEAMPPLELIDHLPNFLDEMAAGLRNRESPETSRIAAKHGEQRLGLGFNVDSVVREYGALRDSIVQTASVSHVTLLDRERDFLSDAVITGIAEAVSEYQRQREAEQHRQTSEHFAFISHELRNPLGAALSALSLLRQKGKLPSDDSTVRVLERGLTRMQELIDSSLRLAQLGAGITIRRERVMLRSLLEEAEMSAAASAEEKGVELSLRLESDVEMEVDARLVLSALTNLVRNAVKFTHAASRVEVRARLEDSRVIIEVEDRCGGLPAGAVEKSFAPFVQMGADRSGFGLGLAIAKQAADAHGGVIRVQNLPGKGCVFALELPARAQ